MIFRRCRRNFRKACLFWIVSVMLIMALVSNMKYELAGHVVGKDWVGCEIPQDLILVSNSTTYLEQYFIEPKCQYEFPKLVESKGNTLYKKPSAFFDSDYLKCFYTPVYRTHPGKNVAIYVEGYRLGKNHNEIRRKVEISSEFVMVNCTYKGASVFEDYFAFYPKKKYSVFPKPKYAYNVLLIGIKGVSRLNLHRTMPETVQYLKQKLEAIDYIKYNKVGRESFNNLAPLLTGFDTDQFKRKCPHKPKGKTLHICPFIMSKYTIAGYRTAFAEDCVSSSIFRGNYVFRTRPTHYFWAPYNVALDDLVGNVEKDQCFLCLRHKLSCQVLLDYARNFVQTMHSASLPYFGVFWTNSLTSTSQPIDGMNTVRVADKAYKTFFEHLNEKGLLANTVIVFLSESGYVNPILANEEQHAKEEKLPFLFVVLPKTFRVRHPDLFDNATRNSQHLVTAYDVHQTLLDLSDASNIGTKHYVQHNKIRAQSLLRNMPSMRQCNWVGIEQELCSCRKSWRNSLLELV